NGIVTLAEKQVPSGMAALLIASVPLWVAIYRIVDGQRVRGGAVAGLVLGCASGRNPARARGGGVVGERSVPVAAGATAGRPVRQHRGGDADRRRGAVRGGAGRRRGAGLCRVEL